MKDRQKFNGCFFDDDDDIWKVRIHLRRELLFLCSFLGSFLPHQTVYKFWEAPTKGDNSFFIVAPLIPRLHTLYHQVERAKFAFSSGCAFVYIFNELYNMDQRWIMLNQLRATAYITVQNNVCMRNLLLIWNSKQQQPRTTFAFFFCCCGAIFHLSKLCERQACIYAWRSNYYYGQGAAFHHTNRASPWCHARRKRAKPAHAQVQCLIHGALTADKAVSPMCL
jgi:hypothetical protein